MLLNCTRAAYRTGLCPSTPPQLAGLDHGAEIARVSGSAVSVRLVYGARARQLTTMRVSSKENCAVALGDGARAAACWRWVGGGHGLGVWMAGEREQEGRGEHTDESGACSQSGSQADEPSRLRGSRRAQTRPAEARSMGRGGTGLSPIGAWPWTMKSLIIDGHSFFGAAARERHRRACWHRHQARLR